MIKLADDLPAPLPSGQVGMKSYLPSRRIFSSGVTGRHFFRALHLAISTGNGIKQLILKEMGKKVS